MQRKFTKSPINAATDDRSDGYNEASDNIQDNFDYAVDGFDKLARNGKDGEQAALQLMLELNEAIESVISKIASTLTE